MLHRPIEMKYSEKAINYAAKAGYIRILHWWKNSGLPLKYSHRATLWASKNGQMRVLKWFVKIENK
jgi:hypothetical protein